MKRLLDMVTAALVLLAACPFFLALAIAVRLKLGRPVFFRQVRPGRNERPFELVKFRTMTNAVDDGGRLLPDAGRMTPLGTFMRRCSMDELPQLWNVLKGDMSLVGPRPLLMDYLPLYSPEQRRRHEVRPGITGWAQVNGRNALTWEDKFRLDVWYVDHRSFWLDVKILMMTLVNVIRGQDTSAEGHVTMPRFTGSRETNPKG